MDVEELKQDLEDTRVQLDIHIGLLKEMAERNGIEVDKMQDKFGKVMILDVLVAKAQVLSSLTLLHSDEVEEKAVVLRFPTFIYVGEYVALRMDNLSHDDTVVYGVKGYRLYTSKTGQWSIADDSGWYSGVYLTADLAVANAIAQGGPEL